jgi:hypothetical protein
MAKKPRLRTERRAAERAAAKLADSRERLARLEPGGAPAHPITVTSASQVEVRARSLGCARCGAEPRVESHEALAVDGRRLRLVRLACPACGARRDAWFALAMPS